MESFDLKNVWNALTALERETIIDAAKDSQGVSWGHYSSVVKGILLSASSAGRVDLSYRDPLFWSAADVLREQGIAEAALRQQKAKLDAETPAEVDESSYPAYVQENIAYFRENLGRLLYDEVQRNRRTVAPAPDGLLRQPARERNLSAIHGKRVR